MHKTKFTVKRSEWLRGGENGVLFHCDTKQRCCLGFLAKEVYGFDDDQMGMIGHISELFEGTDQEEFESWEGDEVDVIKANDNREISDSEREKKLTSIFSDIGFEVKFVD